MEEKDQHRLSRRHALQMRKGRYRKTGSSTHFARLRAAYHSNRKLGLRCILSTHHCSRSIRLATLTESCHASSIGISFLSFVTLSHDLRQGVLLSNHKARTLVRRRCRSLKMQALLLSCTDISRCSPKLQHTRQHLRTLSRRSSQLANRRRKQRLVRMLRLPCHNACKPASCAADLAKGLVLIGRMRCKTWQPSATRSRRGRNLLVSKRSQSPLQILPPHHHPIHSLQTHSPTH